MTTDRGSGPYRRLAGQMRLVLLAFGLVPLTTMGLAGFAAQRTAVETRMRNVLEAMVKNRRATVELFLEEKRRQLELVAAALPVADLVKPRVIEAMRDGLRSEHGGIVDLGVIDDSGRHVAYVGPYKLQDLDYSGQPWFEQVMVRDHYESDIFMGYRRFPHIVMAVKKREGGRTWILRATIDTDLLSDLVREGGLESGADVFVLNRAGEYPDEVLGGAPPDGAGRYCGAAGAFGNTGDRVDRAGLSGIHGDRLASWQHMGTRRAPARPRGQRWSAPTL